MTEANEQEANEQEQKRPLTLGGGTRLELRRPVETGQVRQSFSHGRSKTVTVEVRKKRILVPGAAPEPGHGQTGPAGETERIAAPSCQEALDPVGKLGRRRNRPSRRSRENPPCDRLLHYIPARR